MPTSSFWTAEERIPISQKKVSVQAENGLSYSLGQKINFVIPSTVGFMMPSETYLRMDVKVQLPASGGLTAGVPLTLDGDIGANVLIKDIRISSGGAQNILLEELQNVNILTTLKYDYETNDNLKQKRAMTEGTVLESNSSRPNQGSTVTNMNNVDANPYFTRGTDTTLTNTDFKTVKALLTLPTGIFQNDKVFPLGMTQGLRIEIILEDGSKVFRQMETGLKHRRARANPVFHSLNGSNASRSEWVSGSATTTFYLERANGQVGDAQCPFAVGDTIGFAAPDAFNASIPGDSRIAAAGDTADKILEVKITGIAYVSGATIGDGSANGGLIGITCASTTNTFKYDITPSEKSVKGTNKAWAVYSAGFELDDTTSPTLSIDNVELIVQQVEMPSGYLSKMNSMLKAGGAMNYDFLSYTNYKYSQQVSDRVVNIRLPIQNSRCKSVLCIPTDATGYTAKDSISCKGTYQINKLPEDCGGTGTTGYTQHLSSRSGLVGIADAATAYQFIYDGKLNPNRKVPLNRMSVNSGLNAPINQQVFIENEKALRMANIDPLSFEKYQENFFIGRSLSLASGVYDARSKDFNLQIEYQETAAPSKPKLWNCWVAHLRRIVVRGDSISLEV